MTKPRGIRNNNPGNIRKSAADWLGEIDGQDDAFETFDTPEHGIRALAKILLNYQRKRKLRTISQIISRWAPPNENDTTSYENAVVVAAGAGVDAVIDLENPETLSRIVVAIIHHENGQQPYSVQQISSGIEMAIGS